MRRLLLVLACLLLVLCALTPPATADSTVVVHGISPTETSFGFSGTKCSDPTAPLPVAVRADYAFTDDPDHALGDSKITFTALGSSDVAYGPYVFNPTPASAGTFEVRVNTSATGTEGLASVTYSPDTSPDVWVGSAPISLGGGAGWQTVDAENMELTWRQWDHLTQTWGAPIDGVTRRDFVAGHGGNGQGAAEILAFGCGTDFYLDRFRAGPTGDVTTLDFEGFLTKTTGTATPATITAGQRATLRGVTTMLDGPPFPRESLRLERKPYGATTWTLVASNLIATFDQDTDTVTPASIAQTPARTTQYRWRFPKTPAGVTSVSAPITVTVRTKLTMAVADQTLKKLDYLVLAGSTTPAKSGVPITLQRKVSGVWRPWSSVRTTADGHYRLVKQMWGRGTWTIRTVVGATTGNATGYSPARTLRVS